MSLDLDPNEIWRDFTIDGVPASGAWKPRKIEIRQSLSALRDAVIELQDDAGSSGTIYNLLGYLSDEEQADVLAGTNAIDITAKVQTAITDIATNNPGGILDMRALRGVVTMTGTGWFGTMHTANVTLLTGAVEVKKEFNNGPIALPSLAKWNMERTRVTPLTELITVPSLNDSVHAMLQTWMGEGTCTGTSGATTVSVASIAGLHVGSMIAINGTLLDTTVAHTLSASLNSATTTTFSTGAGSTNLTINSAYPVFVRIGTEIIKCSSVSNGTFNIAQRGAYGTTPATHASGATVNWMTATIGRVLSISGSGPYTLTLDVTLERSFTDAQFYVGAVGAKVSGDFEVYSPFNRSSGLDEFYQNIGMVLASGCRISGTGKLRGSAFSGLFMYATEDCYVDLDEVAYAGRKDTGLGSALWIFGRCRNTHVRVKTVNDASHGIFMDEKSNSAGKFAIELPLEHCSTKVESVINVNTGVFVSGCRRSRAEVGYLDAAVENVVFIDIDTGQRTTAPANLIGNVVKVDVVRNLASTSNIRASMRAENTLLLPAAERTALVTVASITVGPYTTGTSTLTFSGARLNASVLAAPRGSLPTGITIAGAWCPGADQITVAFANVTGSGITFGVNLNVRVRNTGIGDS